MWNSVLLCCLVFVWMVIFNPSLGEPSALLDLRRTDRALHLEALKATLLERLGMDRPPESREKILYQDLLQLHHQYRTLRGNMQHHRGSSLFFFTAAQPLNVQQHQNGMKMVQWFRAVFHRDARITKKFTLGRAQLRLHTQPTHTILRRLNANIPVKIHINSTFHKEIVLSKDLFKSSSYNVTLDVTAAVEKWLTQTKDTLFIVDIGLPRRGRPKAAPQLSLELEQLEGKSRKVRSASENDGHCSRKSLSVSFEEIGWSNWIVAPAGYTMFFCEGSCPHNYKPASMHTQVKSRLYHLTKGAKFRPCCVPTAYEPMILMHYDSRGKLKLTSFNDLIVSECYCA